MVELVLLVRTHQASGSDLRVCQAFGHHQEVLLLLTHAQLIQKRTRDRWRQVETGGDRWRQMEMETVAQNKRGG